MSIRKFGILIVAAMFAGMLFLFLGYASYCLLAQKEIADGKTAFKASEWSSAFQHFERATNFYRFSFPFDKAEVKRLKNQSSLLIYGKNKRAQGDYVTALEAYDSYADLYPESAQQIQLTQISSGVYAEWVTALQQDGQYDKAVEKSLELITLYPKTAAASSAQEALPGLHLEWAMKLRKDGQFEQAIQKFEFVSQEFAQTPDAETAKSAMSETYLEWGDTFVKAENYELAVEKYSVLQKKFPGRVFSRNLENLLGETYLQWAEQLRHNAQPEVALDKYQFILQELKDTPAAAKATSALAPTTLEWALALQKEKQFAEEIELLNKLISEYEKTPEAGQARQMVLPTYNAYGQQLVGNRSFLLAMEAYKDAQAFALDKEAKALVEAGYQTALDGLTKDSGKDGQTVIAAALKTACSGKPAASPAIGVFKKEPAKGLLCGSSFSFPSDWKATTPGNFRYVVEVTEKKEAIQTCPYQFSHYLVRDRWAATITIRDTVTGKPYTTTKLYGSLPPSCPYRRAFSSSYDHVAGGMVSDQTIITWLKTIFK